MSNRSFRLSERFRAIRALSGMGIYTGIILTPVLPYITDNEKNIQEIVYGAEKTGAKYILGWMGLTMREGQRENFYKKLELNFPGLSQKYHRQFGNAYACYSPVAQQLNNKLKLLCADYNIETHMNFYEPPKHTQTELFN